jgi:hypothetical protein
MIAPAPANLYGKAMATPPRPHPRAGERTQIAFSDLVEGHIKQNNGDQPMRDDESAAVSYLADQLGRRFYVDATKQPSSRQSPLTMPTTTNDLTRAPGFYKTLTIEQIREDHGCPTPADFL